MTRASRSSCWRDTSPAQESCSVRTELVWPSRRFVLWPPNLGPSVQTKLRAGPMARISCQCRFSACRRIGTYVRRPGFACARKNRARSRPSTILARACIPALRVLGGPKVDLQPFEPLAPRTFGPSHPCTLGPLDLWTLRPLHPRSLGPSDPCTLGPLDPWTKQPRSARTPAAS